MGSSHFSLAPTDLLLKKQNWKVPGACSLWVQGDHSNHYLSRDLTNTSHKMERMQIVPSLGGREPDCLTMRWKYPLNFPLDGST